MEKLFSTKLLNTYYHSKWNEYQNISKTRNSYKETLEALEQDLRSPSRKRNIPEAQLPTVLKIPRIEEIINGKISSHQVSSPQESNYIHRSHIVHTTPSEQQFVIDASNTPQQHQPNSLLPQPSFYTMLPLATTTPPSNNILTGLQPQRVRHCKTCHSSICPGRTGRGKCPLLKTKDVIKDNTDREEPVIDIMFLARKALGILVHT